MINLNFTDSNSKINEKISLDNIFLSSNNPRYESWLLEEDILNFIIDDSQNVEEKTIIKLLGNEGDFSDLLDLLNSINDEGYRSSEMDPIILLDNINNDFVVAEGNRRIMILKFIKNKHKLPNYRRIFLNLKYSDESFLNNEVEEDFKEINFNKKAEENYKKIQLLIGEIKKKHKNEEWKIFYKIISEKEELIKIIYQKHLAGERLGMKKWPRTKYYVDLLRNFPEGINKESNKRMLLNFRRRESSIINDFKQAQFIYSCIYTENYPEEKNIEFNNEEILLQMSNNFKDISGLETTHSYNKVRNTIIELEKINLEEFKKNYFDIQWPKDKNYRIEFKETEKITRERILRFIYKKWKQNILNTRAIKDKDKKSFLESVRNDLIKYPNINIGSVLNEQQINDLNEFHFNTDDLQKIINVNKSIHKKEIERFEYALKIKMDFNKFKNLYLPLDIENDSFWIFSILINQYKSTDSIYINSLASTIRTFFEQFLIWISCIWINEYNNEITGIIDDEKHHNIAYGRKMQERYTKVSKYFFGDNKEGRQNKHLDEFMEVLKYVYKENAQENIDQHKDFLDQNINEINDVLNEFIHASHRIYLNDYVLNLKKIYKWQEFIYDVFNSINVNKFKETSKFISLNSKPNK